MIDKLKNIVNYSDKQMSHPQAQLMYIDMISHDSDEYKREIKQQNRGLVVDAILDDKVEELNIFRENYLDKVTDISLQYNPSVSSTGIISPKIMTLNLVAKKFERWEKIHCEVIDFLNQNTRTPKSKATGPNNNLDIHIQNDFSQDFKNIMTRIQMCSSLIAIDGRIGPATALIYGKKLIPYIDYALNQSVTNNINGIEVYSHDLIDSDKIILCRANSIDQPGLLLIDNSITGHYFFDQTPNWDKQYAWFKII